MERVSASEINVKHARLSAIDEPRICPFDDNKKDRRQTSCSQRLG